MNLTMTRVFRPPLRPPPPAYKNYETAPRLILKEAGANTGYGKNNLSDPTEPSFSLLFSTCVVDE